MQVAYEALNSDGQVRAETLEAANLAEAADSLRRQGLLVLELRPLRAAADVAEKAAGFRLPRLGRCGSGAELVLFARQMKMLLESGAPLVVSLSAVERQSSGPFRLVVRALRETVEQGGGLAAAMENAPDIFRETTRSMVAAGEATATLPQSFARLSELLEEQFRVKKAVIGALTYPAILFTMICGAILTILLFVVPRFRVLFDTLRAPTPASTQVLLVISDWMRGAWPFLIAAAAAVMIGSAWAARSRRLRAWLGRALAQVPFAGPIVSHAILARLLRLWSALLNSHVPLLDAIRQSSDAVRHSSLSNLTEEVSEALSSGGRMGAVLANSPHVPPIVASAIATAEENARLAEAVSFVSKWLDEDITRRIQRLTQVIEPAMLLGMGLIVGSVAASLFIPLFDVASAAR
ncbi:MAG: type II secretion system F family protein [Phycisphaerae bacterium]